MVLLIICLIVLGIAVPVVISNRVLIEATLRDSVRHAQRTIQGK